MFEFTVLVWLLAGLQCLNPYLPPQPPPPPLIPIRISPLRPMAAGPASVPQMPTVAQGSRHGNKALAGPRQPVC